jgi:hypothetical protein
MMKIKLNLEAQRGNNGTFDKIFIFVNGKCADITFQNYYNKKH